ncbi:MAG TPA: hypothetical protein VGR05_00840 [Sphingomicrobium sp.]|nr:hypothetical protein [Sphingomicrobium sp.]
MRDELEPIGRLSALDAVGTRALEYFEKQDKTELSDEALAQRSQALNLLGQIADARQDTNGALAGYREAMRSTAELVERAPDDPQRLFDHAQNVFYLGEIARDSGDARGAETAYREYERLADRMVAIDPNNLKWRMEVLYAKENIGIVLLDQRRFGEATRLFEESFLPMGSGVSIDSDNADYQKEYSTLLAWLADSYAAQGQLDRAIAIREKQLAYLRRLSGEQSNVVFRQHLIPAHLGLASLFLSQGKIERGIEQLRLSVAESERLLPVEPDNFIWAGMAARSRLQLAKTLLTVKRTEDAATQAQVGCNQAIRVLARNPGPNWRDLQTDCFSVRARLAMANGEQRKALSLANRALASARTERSVDSIRDRYTIAAAHRLLGDMRRQMGDAEEATASWAEGLAQLPSKVTERPTETGERATLLRRLGRLDEARPLVERLEAIGYRRAT